MSDFKHTFESLYGLPLNVRQTDLDFFLRFAGSEQLAIKIGEATLIDLSTPIPKFFSESILAFMWVRHESHIDFYGFDKSQKNTEGQHPVVVFADHATVQSWPNFHTFIEWLQAQ